MKRFELYGIASPGKVYIADKGEVVLEKIDDATAEELWKKGCPYLRPTPEYRAQLNPDEKPIVVKPVTDGLAQTGNVPDTEHGFMKRKPKKF